MPEKFLNFIPFFIMSVGPNGERTLVLNKIRIIEILLSIGLTILGTFQIFNYKMEEFNKQLEIQNKAILENQKIIRNLMVINARLETKIEHLEKK